MAIIIVCCEVYPFKLVIFPRYVNVYQRVLIMGAEILDGHRKIECTHEKWRCSIVLCMFTSDLEHNPWEINSWTLKISIKKCYPSLPMIFQALSGRVYVNIPEAI